MSFAVALRSTSATSLTRYARSKGLWILLLVGLLGARFWLPRNDGTTVIISLNHELPVLTSPMIGLSLGVVLSTLLLPLGFMYLRSNVTRRQPWQIIDVTAASRVATSLGLFFADSAVLFALLVVMTIAGWLMAWFFLPASQIHLWQIALALALTGVPTVMGLAAARRLLHAFSWTRRAFGDAVFFALWLGSIMLPFFSGTYANTFRANMYDFGGSIQVLSHCGNGLENLNIGFGMSVMEQRVYLDLFSMLTSGSYIAARLTWALLAIAVAALAGILYRPQTAKLRKHKARFWSRWLSASPAPGAPQHAAAANGAAFPYLNLLLTELRLVMGSRLFLLLGAGTALSGLFIDYRHAVSPAILLLLILGLTAQAAREESRGMLALTTTTAFSPFSRRLAFVAAGLCGSLLLSLPALARHPDLHTLGLAAAIGLGASIFTIVVTALTCSAFAARLLLLIFWYGYISAK